MTNYIYRKASILKFYKDLNFSSFSSISPERKLELDDIVEKWRDFFILNSVGLQTLMTLTAEKITTSSKKFGLNNNAEKAYFYINVVDPNLLFLEVFECSNKDIEIKNICINNFYFFDKFLIYLEKEYNEYFKIYKPDELWSRGLIKKDL